MQGQWIPFSAGSVLWTGFVPLFRYLGEDCGSGIQVRGAARICGMSESYFMSFFKRVTGLSFMEYLNHYRIERAQALLANTDDSMASISQEMGFCDQSYFGAVFRRVIGMTPATYRRRFRNKNITDRAEIHQPSPVLGARFSRLTAPPQAPQHQPHPAPTLCARPGSISKPSLWSGLAWVVIGGVGSREPGHAIVAVLALVKPHARVPLRIGIVSYLG